MGIKRLYENWVNDLQYWRRQLRHLKWVSDYRMNIIRKEINLKGKLVLDCGSGPQFTTDLLKEAGAKVVTLDKFAPCDVCCDINDQFTSHFEAQKFDLVVMGAVIRYVCNKEKFFNKIKKVLKPKGIIFIDEFVHNLWNDAFLDFMNALGAMEQWPKENFTPLKELESIISNTESLNIDKIYSCWPGFFMEGKYPFSIWYSLIVKNSK